VPIRGVTNAGFIPPKQLDADTSLYNVFYKYDFVFNPARMELNSISLNLEYDQAICSSLYEIFYVNNADELLPEYLNLFIKRDEFARFCWYDAIGSARNYFRVANLQEILFPLPNIDIQHELVDTYNGLKALAEQNEALSKPLSEACQAYIAECKKKYREVELGEYIEPCDERNRDLSVKLSQGISNTKEFQSPKQVATNSNNDKIVRKGQFAYNRATTRNGEKISIAYRIGEDCTVSSAYQIFKVTNKARLNPHFLLLWFKRSEFDRYARYVSKGSAHEFFEFDEMCRVKIPLPPPEVQQAIVNLFNCAEEAKKIASDAREKMKNLCPALVQRAING
jgi:type I restriction enzyme S subunit